VCQNSAYSYIEDLGLVSFTLGNSVSPVRKVRPTAQF
jgi:hypothetical protein